MSVELETLLSDCSDAGVVFYVRGGAVSLRMMRGPVLAAGLLARIGAAKNEIRVWLVDAFSSARCIDCPREEHCSGTDCRIVNDDAAGENGQKVGVGGTPV